MSEFINHRPENEQPVQPGIQELLPRYYETHGDMLRYEIERSIPIDGHEVAWLKYSGETTNGRSYSGHELHCECKFTEGVGWQVDEKYGVVGLNGEDRCLPRKAALLFRQLELRREYLNKFPHDSFSMGDEYDLWDKVPEVILDLIEKGKTGEWLSEGSSGANDWGGYFYLQTVQAITCTPYDEFWNQVNKMVYDKKIQLEGMVVQEYREPPAPQWGEYARIEYEGYTGIAKLPTHSKMPQHWEIVILAPNGRLIAEGIEGPTLMHSPDFGVDVEDAVNVEAVIKEYIDSYLWNPMS